LPESRGQYLIIPSRTTFPNNFSRQQGFAAITLKNFSFKGRSHEEGIYISVRAAAWRNSVAGPKHIGFAGREYGHIRYQRQEASSPQARQKKQEGQRRHEYWRPTSEISQEPIPILEAAFHWAAFFFKRPSVWPVQSSVFSFYSPAKLLPAAGVLNECKLEKLSV
jgi:hypothetical protein